jgi:hypothetical protein
MRFLIPLIALTVLFTDFAKAQEVPKTHLNEIPPKVAPELQSFTLTIVEFRMKTPANMNVESLAKDFDKIAAAGQLISNETLRIRLLENFTTEILFGKSVAVIAGMSQTVNGKTRNMIQRQIGTSVRATVESKNEKMQLKLIYEVSRFLGEAQEDSAPDIETVKIDTNLLLENGKRVVVAGTISTDSRYLLVTITK